MQALGLLADRRHYFTMMRLPFVYPEPVSFLRRYIFRQGAYPAEVKVRAGGRRLAIGIYSPDDAATVNQIFGRLDYPCPADARVILDIGANIGVASLFFLATAPHAVVHAYEPDRRNLERLRRNTAPLAARLQVHEDAVSDFEGVATFQSEPTGRYGSLADDAAQPGVKVQVRDIRRIVDDLLAEHGRIDVLKVDIEGHEERVLAALEPGQLARIGRINAEYAGPLELPGFRRRQWGIVSQYARD